MHLIVQQRNNIELRFRRALRRIVAINRFGKYTGLEVNFVNFSFGQSIVQTIKSTADEEQDLDELQIAK